MAAKKEGKKVISKVAPKLIKPKNGLKYSQAEFIECFRASCGFDNRRVAKEVYASFVVMIQSALKKGYKIPMPGVGKMQVRISKPRMARNPQTGQMTHVPARKRVKLTISKALKDAVL